MFHLIALLLLVLRPRFFFVKFWKKFETSIEFVKEFVEEVRKKAVGAEVVRGVTPDQKFIQVVQEQLVEIMGGDNSPLANSAFSGLSDSTHFIPSESTVQSTWPGRLLRPPLRGPLAVLN